eukprot:s2536_g9.t1
MGSPIPNSIGERYDDDEMNVRTPCAPSFGPSESESHAVPVPGGFHGVNPEDPVWEGVRHVFIHNLPARATEAKLLAFVRELQAPLPAQLKFPTYANGKSRGYASMTFETPEQASRFVTAAWQQRLPGFRKLLPLACEPSLRKGGSLRDALNEFGLPGEATRLLSRQPDPEAGAWHSGSSVPSTWQELVEEQLSQDSVLESTEIRCNEILHL